MEFLFDTANLDEIRSYGEIFPYTGVTSNPSILKKEGKVDFFAHFNALRAIIGDERTLHIQVTARNAEGMLREAAAILENVDSAVCIKVPVDEEGLKTIRALKKLGATVTATGIYAKMQGYLATAAGADYLAVYYNRMENLGVDAADVVSSLADQIANGGYSTKILGASFKNVAQLVYALESGAHAVTTPPALLREALAIAPIGKAVDDFARDWAALYGQKRIDELA